MLSVLFFFFLIFYSSLQFYFSITYSTFNRWVSLENYYFFARNTLLLATMVANESFKAKFMAIIVRRCKSFIIGRWRNRGVACKQASASIDRRPSSIYIEQNNTGPIWLFSSSNNSGNNNIAGIINLYCAVTKKNQRPFVGSTWRASTSFLLYPLD